MTTRELISRMAHANTKAGKFFASLTEATLTVKELDDLLLEIGHQWVLAYTHRQHRAQIEGDTTPPPPAPVAPETYWAKVTAAASNTVVVPTVDALIDRYLSDEGSPFHALRYPTRVFYGGQAKRISEEIGPSKLADLNSDIVEEKRLAWVGQSGEPMANSLISILRIIINYGAKVLKDKECQRLAGSIKGMRIKPKGSSTPRILTRGKANELRAQAHKRNKPSIALAQALQFECNLTAIDIIGQWVPLEELGNSEIKNGGKKWVSGLRWNEIKDSILTHTLSRSQKEIRIDLRNCPMVMDELSKIEKKPSTGPVIVCESTGLPWVPGEFRRWWRKLAREVNIPNDVRYANSSGAEEDGDEIAASGN